MPVRRWCHRYSVPGAHRPSRTHTDQDEKDGQLAATMPKRSRGRAPVKQTDSQCATGWLRSLRPDVNRGRALVVLRIDRKICPRARRRWEETSLPFLVE